MDNRWILTLNSYAAKGYLLRHGLSMFNKKIKLRSYDDVLNDEYIEYLQYEKLQKKLFATKQQLAALAGNDELKDRGYYCEYEVDKLEAISDLRLVDDAHKGPPTTAVNTPEPTDTAF